MFSPLPGNPTPNDYFRHFRRLYLLLVTGGITTMLLALMLVVRKIGHPIFGIVLVSLGMLVMLFARFVKGGAACPQCGTSLLWKKGQFGTGRASFGLKQRCPECDLDLERAMDAATDRCRPHRRDCANRTTGAKDMTTPRPKAQRQRRSSTTSARSRPNGGSRQAPRPAGTPTATTTSSCP